MNAVPVDEDGALQPARAHILYRFFDARDQLLYVGITNSPLDRFNAHSADKPWYHEAVRATMEHFPTRAHLEVAEVRAIQRERPRHNVKHATTVQMPTPRPSRRLSRDANSFGRTDGIACDGLSRVEREARLQRLEEFALAPEPPLVQEECCPYCDKFRLVEHRGKINCLNCFAVWTPTEFTEDMAIREGGQSA